MLGIERLVGAVPDHTTVGVAVGVGVGVNTGVARGVSDGVNATTREFGVEEGAAGGGVL
jgi:hypothetical protein